MSFELNQCSWDRFGSSAKRKWCQSPNSIRFSAGTDRPRKRVRTLGACILAIGLLLTAEALAAPDQGQLCFGWSVRSITPDKAVAICGQYGTRISARVHDPIQATALALETRGEGGVIDQAVWISCDLVGIRRQIVEKVRDRIKAQAPDLDVNKILVSTTHTHTAPALTDARETELHPYDFAGSWAYRIPKDRADVLHPADYVEFLVQRLSEAVVAAWKGRRPGGFSWALGHAVIAHNRRPVYLDGASHLYGNVGDPSFTHIEGMSDHSVDLLCFWRDARLEGIALTVYCPAQEVEGETYLSADFWHDTRKLLRERYGSDLQVLPLCGASGDQSPHLLWNKQAHQAMLKRFGRTSRQEIAHRIVHAVNGVMDAARRDIRTEVVFRHRAERVSLPVWKVSEERFVEARARFEAGKDKTEQLSSPDYINWRVSRTLMKRYAHQKEDPYYQAELHFLRLGELAVATNPFELYTDYGLAVKARSPAVQASVVQLTGDSPAYLPTPRAVAAGGYSARIDDGVVGPEGGEALVRKSAGILKEMWP